MQRPIKLEILCLLPITYRQCSHCETFYDQAGLGAQVHDQIGREYPEDLREDACRLGALVIELSDRYKDDLSIQIIDPQSLTGLYRSLRFRVRKYPAFIIDNHTVVRGWDREGLELALKAHASPIKSA
jgi:hypothetical protein